MSEFEAQARKLFDALAFSADEGRFHLPHAEAGGLSSWSSAYHALALAEFDPKLAAEELRTLFAVCQNEAGLVAASVEAAAAGTAGGVSPMILPPVAAFAAARLAKRHGDEYRELLESATRQLDAIWGERLPSDTDLPVILHPFESGTPDSPLFDDLVAGDGEDRDDEVASLARSAGACGYDPERALRAGHAFVVEDPCFCGWFLLALEAARDAWDRLGATDQLRKFEIRSRMIAEAIADRLWSDQDQIFVGFDRARGQSLRVVTSAGLLPAASQALAEDGRGRQAVARYLAPGGSAFWGTHGISFNPIVRGPRTLGVQTHWRGNAASPVVQFWARLALERVGRDSDASVIRDQLGGVIESAGPCEWYDAVSGEPGGASPHGHASLICALAS